MEALYLCNFSISNWQDIKKMTKRIRYPINFVSNKRKKNINLNPKSKKNLDIFT